ncbi:AAA family ATPase [Schlesneria paludicola]|uniref:AAA family ATPase n=1 Tax=Schlesneria paludicola TaxID=360056 RepID=UPI00029A1A89|nr:AAA family ATPase [Schlesneria paludicola]
MPGPQAGLVASCLGDLEARPIVWLWGELVARGMVSILAGPSGVGKSFVAIDVAAAVTQGDRKTVREPDTQPTATTSDAHDVLFVSPEYEIAEVLRPRLMAAGADMQRMHVIHGIRAKEEDCIQDECRPIQLQEDLPLLKQEIERRHAAGSSLRLIVVDPFLQEPLNDRADRANFLSTMQELARIAAATQVAILLVVNCPSKANLRMIPLESIAQSVWWVDSDPYRPERRLLLPVKTNLVAKTPARSFVLNEGRAQWDCRPIWMTAERFQVEVRERARRPLFDQEFSELARAMCWLRDFMHTDTHEFKHVKAAADFVGLGERTLRRAFCGLKGISWRIPGANSWAWKLRDDDVVHPHLPWTLDRFLYDETEGEQAVDNGTNAAASKTVNVEGSKS